jgi:hypothetical protein
MSDVRQEDHNGNRATVAMVYRAVDDLAKIHEAEFRSIHQRLDALVAIPAQLAALTERQLILDSRITRVEESGIPAVHELMQSVDRLTGRVRAVEEAERAQGAEALRNRDYRRTSLPTIVLSTGTFVLAVVNVVFFFSH